MLIPGREWIAAKRSQTKEERDRLAVWLGLPVADALTWYAVLPFVRMATDDGPRVAATLGVAPCLTDSPHAYADPDADVLTVSASGRFDLHRVKGHHVVGTMADGALYADARQFVRDWARKRLVWLHGAVQRRTDYGFDIIEPLDANMPGSLVIGDAAKVTAWPAGVAFTAPDEATAKVINIAIWKAARLSRAAVASPEQRASA